MSQEIVTGGAERWRWHWLRQPLLAVFALVVALAALGNFFWTRAEFEQLGGDASGGMVQDGRYFVGNRGVYREVTREQWEWSQWHGRLFFPIHLLGLAANAYLFLVWIIPRLVGRSRPDTPKRVAEVRASGPPLASASVSAQLGYVRLRGPLLRISVHPGGIVLEPFLMPPRAIRRSEFTRLEYRPPSLGGLGQPAVTIHHTAPDVGKTVRISVDERHPLAQAIRSLLAA